MKELARAGRHGARRAAGIALLAALVLLAACGPDAPAPATATIQPPQAGTKPAAGSAWRTITAQDGGFQVAMPGDPATRTSIRTTPAGPVSVHIWELVQADVTFTATFADYPAAAGSATPAAGDLLRQARDALLPAPGATIQDEMPVTVAGYPGRAFTAQAPGAVVHARVYQVGRRLYTLAARTADATTKANAVQRFLSSFRLTGQGG